MVQRHKLKRKVDLASVEREAVSAVVVNGLAGGEAKKSIAWQTERPVMDSDSKAPGMSSSLIDFKTKKDMLVNG